jgi:hypothetical protein
MQRTRAVSVESKKQSYETKSKPGTHVFDALGVVRSRTSRNIDWTRTLGLLLKGSGNMRARLTR